MRRALIVVLALSGALLAALPFVPAGAVGDEGAGAPGPVLVVSAPALRWVDLVDHDLPNLEAFMSDSTVAMLSLRTLGARTSIGEGYITMGAGNRASASASLAGLALEPGERFEEGIAAHAFERRTTIEPSGELLHVGFPSIERVNNRYLYGAEPGILAQTLAEESLVVGAVANADLGIGLQADPLETEPAAPDEPVGEEDVPPEEEEPEDPESEEPVEAEGVVDSEDEEAGAVNPLVDSDYGRAAALAAMDRSGQVAVGRVAGLLVRDTEAPYGVRLRPEAVVEAVDEMYATASVGFVELSDLDRADAYRGQANRAAAEEMWERALAASDVLFGQLLDTVPAGTTVLVVTPAAPRAAESLGVFAMSDGEPGGNLAESGATRRPGYVTLPDIAPTILQHFDVDQPTAMTGTAISRSDRTVVGEERFEAFADTTSEAIFRDESTGPISVVFVIAQIVAYALAAVAVARRRGWIRPVSYLALVILATPPVAFLAGTLHIDGGNVTTYALGIFGAAVVLAALAEAIAGVVAARWPRTRATLAPLLLVSLTWTVLVADVLTGGRLQINTVFGYSPLVAGRFAGFGNLAFALVGVGAVVVACGAWATLRLAAERADGSARLRGFPVALMVAFLGATVIVDGAPMWGADVGGVLATVPAFAVLVLVAMGVRVDLKRAVLIGAATLMVLAAFAALDLARPEEDRTHLGRLVARVVDDEGGGFSEVIQRKIGTNISILTSSVWTLTIPFALGFLVYLARRQRGFLRDLQEEVPGIRAMLAGGLLVAFLGFTLNDSGVAVPAMMFAVLLPYLTYVLLRWDPAAR